MDELEGILKARGASTGEGPLPVVARPRARAGGTAIVLVLGLILILGTFGGILKLLSASAYREVDVVTSHLKAVAVGEAGFSEIVARLASVPWATRWFKGNPDIQYGIKAAGGTYSYLLRDVQPPATPPAGGGAQWLSSPNQADLLVQATYQRSSVVMYWRLTIPTDSLDSIARAVPSVYSQAPEEAPIDNNETDVLSQEVAGLVAARETNSIAFETLRPKLTGATKATEIASALGVAAPKAIVDSLVPVSGGPPRDDGTYVAAATAADSAAPPAAPALPPTDAASGTVPPTSGGGNSSTTGGQTGPTSTPGGTYDPQFPDGGDGSGLTWGFDGDRGRRRREGWGDWGGDGDRGRGDGDWERRREGERDRNDKDKIDKQKIDGFLGWSREAELRLTRVGNVFTPLPTDPQTGADLSQIGRDASAAAAALAAARQALQDALSQGSLRGDAAVTAAAKAAAEQAAAVMRQAKNQLPPGYDAANLFKK